MSWFFVIVVVVVVVVVVFLIWLYASVVLAYLTTPLLVDGVYLQRGQSWEDLGGF